MPDTVQIHNGPDTVDVTEEALALLLAEPRPRWGNLEIAVLFADRHASIHWSGFIAGQSAVGSGFLIRHDGESPVGSRDSPECLAILDGGSERFTATARHLLDAREAAWLVWQFGRRARRPTHWPDGRPVVWSDVFVDDTPWRAVGALDEPYFDGVLDRLLGAVNPVEPAVDWPRPRDEPAWLGQRCVRPAERALTDHEAETLPRTAIWSVLRELDGVADASWLILIARHPMPWLRSLTLSLDALGELPAAMRGLPRLRALAMYGECLELPAIEAPLLEDLFVECSTGERMTEFLRSSHLPALRLLALTGALLSAPVDFTPLRAGAVVHVELGPDDELERLRNATSARILSLELAPEHTAEALVEALAGRAEQDTWVSSLWDDAAAAEALAGARGIRLRVG